MKANIKKRMRVVLVGAGLLLASIAGAAELPSTLPIRGLPGIAGVALDASVDLGREERDMAETFVVRGFGGAAWEVRPTVYGPITQGTPRPKAGK